MLSFVRLVLKFLRFQLLIESGQGRVTVTGCRGSERDDPLANLIEHASIVADSLLLCEPAGGEGIVRGTPIVARAAVAAQHVACEGNNVAERAARAAAKMETAYGAQSVCCVRGLLCVAVCHGGLAPDGCPPVLVIGHVIDLATHSVLWRPNAVVTALENRVLHLNGDVARRLL